MESKRCLVKATVEFGVETSREALTERRLVIVRPQRGRVHSIAIEVRVQPASAALHGRVDGALAVRLQGGQHDRVEINARKKAFAGEQWTEEEQWRCTPNSFLRAAPEISPSLHSETVLVTYGCLHAFSST